MLFKRETLQQIAAGEVTLAFRRWRRPTVRAGGTLRTAAGVLAIDRIEVVTADAISERDARRAGHPSRTALMQTLDGRAGGAIHRIDFHLAGPDPRHELRRRAALNAGEAAELVRRLARYDAASRYGPWTYVVLRAIATHPGVRAADLAAAAGFEKEWLKSNVRKLKDLGLTESLEIGYRLSPRGWAYLESIREE